MYVVSVVHVTMVINMMDHLYKNIIYIYPNNNKICFEMM